MATDFSKMTEAQIDTWAKEHDVDLSRCPDKQHKNLICAEYEDDNTDKEVEVDGIKLTVNLGRMNEYGTFEALAKYNKGDLSVLPDLLDKLFGDDWGRIEKALTKAGGGRLSVARVSVFLNGVYSAANAKN